jgi:DNA polymerase III sliding clamp (beta) subunit (PCNA family)
MYVHSRILTEQLKFITGGLMKPAFPEIYANALVEYNAKRNKLTLRAFNGVCHVKTILGQPEGRSIRLEKDVPPFMAFSPRKLLSALSKINDQIFIHFDFNAKKIKVKSPRSSINDVCIPGDEFIPFPDIATKVKEIPVPEFIKLGLQRLIFVPDTKSFHDTAKGVLFSNSDGVFTLAATDQQTLVKSTDVENSLIVESSALVPVESVEMMIQLLLQKKQMFFGAVTADQVAISTKRDMIVSIGLEAQFPEFTHIIDGFKNLDTTTLKISKGEFIEAIGFTSSYADDSYRQLIITTTKPNLMHLSSGEMSSGGMVVDGSYSSEIEIPFTGDEKATFKCLIHIPKIVAALKSIDSEVIEMVIPQTNAKAICIMPEGTKVSTIYFIALMSPDMMAPDIPEEEE